MLTSIVFSCRIADRKYLIEADDTDVPLTNAELTAFADLLLAKLKREPGLTRLPSVVGDIRARHTLVHRLRNEFNSAFGGNIGPQLIVHAAKSEYYLAVPREAIVIDPSIEALAPTHLSARIVNDLLEYGGSDDPDDNGP